MKLGITCGPGDVYRAVMSPHEMTPAMVEAAQLMEDKRFGESAVAWEAIAHSDANNAALASMQAGAAYFFQEDYERAVNWYRYAGERGYDPDEVAEHIQEADEAMADCPAEQFADFKGQVCVNFGGRGWIPYAHPREGESVLAPDGGMWSWHSGGWRAQAHNGQAGVPRPGDRVFVVALNRFFLINSDGTWSAVPTAEAQDQKSE